VTPEKLTELEVLESAAWSGTVDARGAKIEQDGLPVAYCSESFISDHEGFRNITAKKAAANAALFAGLRNSARDLFSALRRSWSENVRLRAELESHDCAYGDTPGLIHCPIDKPCTTHKLERITKGEV